jgi:hypothetical protein
LRGRFDALGAEGQAKVNPEIEETNPMKLSNIGLNAATSILALLIVGAPLSGQQESGAAPESQEQRQLGWRSIEGSWIFTITRTDGTVFTAFQSYTAGGEAVGTGSIQTPPTSGLHGTWKRKGPNLLFTRLIFLYSVSTAVTPRTCLRTESSYISTTRVSWLVPEPGFCATLKGDNCFGIGGISLLGKRIPAE